MLLISDLINSSIFFVFSVIESNDILFNAINLCDYASYPINLEVVIKNILNNTRIRKYLFLKLYLHNSIINQ